MNRFRLSIVFFCTCLLVGLTSACGLAGGSEDDSGRWQVQPGALIFYGDTSTVALDPDTVEVGQPLRVSATTFGGGCTAAAGMKAEVQDRTATLTPLDSLYDPGPGGACTSELRILDHSAEVTFESAGKALVVFQGTRQAAGVEGTEDARLQREVVVVK